MIPSKYFTELLTHLIINQHTVRVYHRILIYDFIAIQSIEKPCVTMLNYFQLDFNLKCLF